MDDKMRKEVLGEVLMGELKVIREYVQDIPAIKQDVAVIKDDVETLKTDMNAVKAVIREHDQEIKLLKEKVA